MKNNVKFKRKVLASAIAIAVSGGVSFGAVAAPSNSELWETIQEQKRTLEQQQKLIDELSSRLGQTDQKATQNEQMIQKSSKEIETAARTVKEVEVKVARADASSWYAPASDGYRDKLSITGGYTWGVPGDAANVFAIQCFGCSDTRFISSRASVDERESNLSNFVGGIKWTREFRTYDFAFGFNAGYLTDTLYTLSASDSNPLGTPYGTLDSSSGGASGTSEDTTLFFTGDAEYGWHLGGPNNIRLHAGLRVEYLDWERTANQDLSSSADYEGIESSTFFGIGPRVGASFERSVNTSGNLSVFGGISGGFLYGSRDHEVEVSANTNGNYTTLGDETELIPFGDAEAGLGYLIGPDAQIQIGYQGAYQQDILDTYTVCTNDFADASRGQGNKSCGNGESDYWMHGPFLRFNAYF